MRVLMQSEADANTLGPCLQRGISSDLCQLETIEVEQSASAVWSRVLRRWAPGHAFAKENARLLSRVEATQPDVVWLFKGMEIYPSTLGKLRELGILLVNYNPDHPFRYFSRGSGNNNVLRSIPKYHIHLTYSQAIAREMNNLYPSVDTRIVPFGHDVSETVYARIIAEDEINRVCFLGNPDEHRAREIGALVEAEIPVDVFGHRWDRFLKPAHNLQTHPQIVGEAMYRTLRRYRVQMNFFRPHNVASHNMRSFEVPACGGIMLAEDSIEHREFFESGQEAFYFRTRSEMVENARALLAISKQQANQVRGAARRRSINSGYSYAHRAQAALQIIEEANKRTRK